VYLAAIKITESIRNIAIIAHVDHGKTTLVDKIMYHCQLFRDNENAGDLILDNNDLERERGITITLKCFGSIQRNENQHY
jgi:GTP-binding protein